MITLGLKSGAAKAVRLYRRTLDKDIGHGDRRSRQRNQGDMQGHLETQRQRWRNNSVVVPSAHSPRNANRCGSNYSRSDASPIRRLPKRFHKRKGRAEEAERQAPWRLRQGNLPPSFAKAATTGGWRVGASGVSPGIDTSSLSTQSQTKRWRYDAARDARRRALRRRGDHADRRASPAHAAARALMPLKRLGRYMLIFVGALRLVALLPLYCPLLVGSTPA
jgi:hypothetical protein